ncbi:MAG: threonine synthase [Firmicutes bacterium]|nr:threonine synthase [Bacillota bacterium]
MLYQSTRNKNLTADSVDAVLQGLAPDGGLYIADPGNCRPDWKQWLLLEPVQMSAAILNALLPDYADLGQLTEESYRGKFEAADLTPLVRVEDRYVLELFHGPTCAFKDVALSVLPRLVTAGRAQKQKTGEVVILTATSGDTGKAALEGFHDVDGTGILVFYPYQGTSPLQELQMTTQRGRNVKVCAVRGNFDDVQTAVKKIFARASEMELHGQTLNSANSINIGRLAPQIMYYFKAYADLVKQGRIAVGEPVQFVVPTGNFGDILAGYFAKLLGLPVAKLICASNSNRILTDFIRTGVYDTRREFYKTTSPSMDILVSSNLERLLWLLSRDEEKVAGWMQQLSQSGVYRIDEDLRRKMQDSFACGYADDEVAVRSIGEVFRATGYLMDPHTAVAWTVSKELVPDAGEQPVVVLSTASPFKFPAACLTALGEEPSGDEFAQLDRLQALSGKKAPKALAGLRTETVRFRDVIEPDEMEGYVERFLKERSCSHA